MEKNLKPIGALFADSWRLYKKNMNVFALISVIPFLFAGVKIALSPYLYTFTGIPNGAPAATILGVFSFLYLVFLIVMPIAVTIAVHEAQHGKPLDANVVYKKAFSQLMPYLVILFLAGIITFGGSILFIIPGIIAGVYLSLSMYVFLFEGKTGIDALIHSAWYVRQFWWDILARKIALVLLVIVSLVIFGFIVGGCVFALGFSPLVFQFLLNLFLFMVVAPFSLIFYYLVYKDVKRAKSARNVSDVPEKGFVLEAEKLYIILIIVAAVVALLFFCAVSFSSHAYGMAYQHNYHHWR